MKKLAILVSAIFAAQIAHSADNTTIQIAHFIELDVELPEYDVLITDVQVDLDSTNGDSLLSLLKKVEDNAPQLTLFTPSTFNHNKNPRMVTENLNKKLANLGLSEEKAYMKIVWRRNLHNMKG